MTQEQASTYSMGLATYPVPISLYATNRSKLVASLRKSAGGPSSAASPPGSVVYLCGGQATTRDSTDHEPVFRQESYFHYLFGVREPDFAGCVEVGTGRAVLFVPRLPEDYATVMGRIKSCDDVRRQYGVDEVRYVDEAEEYLAEIVKKGGAAASASASASRESAGSNDAGMEAEDEKKENNGNGGESAAECGGGAKILLLSGPNTDSGKVSDPPTLPESLRPHADAATLHPILAECRVTKSPAELQLLRYVTELTSLAHAYTMKNTHPGMMEYQSESLFRHFCYYNFGARHLGYTAICGCGPSGAVLHYGHAGAPNDRRLRDGDMCLFDIGAEYCCYGSDVTCSFPANGKFSDRQRAVYEGVLNAQRAVYDMLKPGVSWVDCHKAAEVEILRALVGLGIVVPGSTALEQLVELRLGAVFMPHGLGHLIGIDTHDVGGYLPGHPERIIQPGLRSLRTARIMGPGMTVTVEPGCYFIDHLIDASLAESSSLRQYLDGTVLETYRGFGGVRLEDVVAVTEDGCTNYTLCPRTVEEVENVVGGGRWPPTEDGSPDLRRERLFDPSPLRPVEEELGAIPAL